MGKHIHTTSSQPDDPSHPAVLRSRLLRKLYLYNVLTTIGGGLYGGYYSYFLYASTFDLKVLVTNAIVAGVGVWSGYVVGTLRLQRFGHLAVLRFSLILSLVTALFTYILASNLLSWYPFVSILQGAAAGVGAAVVNLSLLKDVEKRARGGYYHYTYSISLAVGVILPLLANFIIKESGTLPSVFLVAAAVYGVGLFGLRGATVRSSVDFVLPALREITQGKGFHEFTANRLLNESVDQLNGFLTAIIPFLMVKSVFDLGILSSVMAIVAALVSLLARRFHPSKQEFLGYLGSLGRFLSNAGLALRWTTPALVLRGLGVQIVSAFTDPFTSQISVSNLERVATGRFGVRAVEASLLDATLAFVGKTLGLGLFLLVLSGGAEEQAAVVRIFLVTYGAWKMLNLKWIVRLHRKLREQPQQLPARAPILEPVPA